MVIMTADMKIVQCCIVGDGMVGKTCLALNIMHQNYPKDYTATVLEHFSGSIKVSGDEYRLNIYDSAGQHDYESLRACTYKDSEIYVVCYSVVDRESLESVKQFWIPEIKKHMDRKKPIILIGTQTDLRQIPDYDICITVSTEEGSTLAKEIGAVLFMECTCKNQNSVKRVIESVVSSALKYRKKKKSTLVNKIFRRLT
ncbi:hypothetical protein CHS0354_039648 [Potamilus streckersoni]|uniref:Uncharacterized protein n=1 Tax=Potamilus streckersoni TaxID=2493646 RepID=A0AAE0SK21_9BIVA|nr:hypothetical protein CHS0354_039648 [Potamilus streckersoni]